MFRLADKIWNGFGTRASGFRIGGGIGGLLLGAATVASCSPSTGGDAPGGASGFGGASAGGAIGTGNSGGVVNPSDGGAPNTGGVVIIFQNGGAAGNAGSNARDAGLCGKENYKGEIVPLDIYIMFDQSASMSCPIAGNTPDNCATPCRWNAVKSALTSFVQSAGAATINVGLGYFGTAASPPGSSCDPKAYVPDVEIGPLSTNAPAIVNSLNAHNPLTDTPTLPALQSAITHAITWKAQNPGHTVVVVLVTDGQPNACGANTVDQVVAVADTGNTGGGIPTYVIGIVSPGSTCNLDPNQPTPADLDKVAKAGGTDAALIVDTTNTTQDPGAQFLDTMNKIRQTAQIPCEYTVPTPKDGAKLDPFKVNVDYKDPNGAPGELGPAAVSPEKAGWTDKNDCSKGGWYYDTDPNDVNKPPTKIILCPSSCTQLTATFGFEVQITLGCPIRPPPH